MANDITWTVKRCLDWCQEFLAQKGDEHARLSAEWLISAATGLSRVDIYMNFDRPMEPSELARLREGVKRRALGEPLQYVTGEMAFRHLIVRCAPGVLIPRPETEVLVDEVLSWLNAEGFKKCAAHRSAPALRLGDSELKALELEAQTEEQDYGEASSQEVPQEQEDIDLAAVLLDDTRPLIVEVGTGTGCVALSIAQEFPGAHLLATDISDAAIECSSRNRDALGLTDAVDIIKTDLVADIPQEAYGQVDVLVSNPPYIPSEVIEREVPSEVKDFEPHLALDGGQDGLDVYRRLLEVAPRLLKTEHALFAVELHETTLDAAAELAQATGAFAEVRIVQDLTHRPRFIIATR